MSNSRSRSLQINVEIRRCLLTGSGVFPHPCLPCFASFLLRPNSSSPPPIAFLHAFPISFLLTRLARVFHVDDRSPSTVKTSHFARNARCTGCWKMCLHPLLVFLTHVCLACASVILSCGARWKSRERLASSHVDEIFSRILPVIAGLSASMYIFT